MLLSTLLLVVLPALAYAAPAKRDDVCTKIPYNLILPFSNYAPAQTFCWSKYPGKTQTVTSQQPPKTTWSTRTSKGCYTYTKTTTSKCPMTTSSTTSTTSSVVTVTFTVPDVSAKAIKLKRNDPTASAWGVCTSKLLQSGAKFLSTACSCIETTKTATVSYSSPSQRPSDVLTLEGH